ncbi:hypothetical protein [Aquibacillus saliphilus]|uniref:hypothetical protein n=1 Tax=Aquibacillus saliphilus TaxID=1909422 RepID=UPI001CF01240|nr:hypothetical protein [Aquibacillus saliphilus]
MKILERNKGKWIDELGITQGDHANLFLFLTKEEESFDLFMDKFYTNNIVTDLMAFQRYKRAIERSALNVFLRNIKTNRKLALENELQEPVSYAHINLMDDLNITHLELYEKIIHSTNQSFLSILKNWNIVDFETADDFLLDL